MRICGLPTMCLEANPWDLEIAVTDAGTAASAPLDARLLDREAPAPALRSFGESTMLPVAAYTSPDVLAWERRHVFAGTWTCLGRDVDLTEGGVRQRGRGGRRRPRGKRLTIDPAATRVATYGRGKEASAFSRTGQTALSPLIGVVGETGDVLAVRARGGAANDGRAIGSFIDECVAAGPQGARDRYRLWIRVDSAGYQHQVIEAAERHHADYSVTVKQ